MARKHKNDEKFLGGHWTGDQDESSPFESGIRTYHPPELTAVQPRQTASATAADRNLGLLLQGWHSSGGDPIYAAGSSLFSGRIPPVDVLERAQIEIGHHMIDPRFAGEAFRGDARELKKIFNGLERLIKKGRK